MKLSRFGGVVATEVDRFAHFGDGVRDGLARLVHQQCEEAIARILERVGGAFEAGCAHIDGLRRPVGARFHSDVERGAQLRVRREIRRRRERGAPEGAVTSQRRLDVLQAVLASEVKTP